MFLIESAIIYYFSYRIWVSITPSCVLQGMHQHSFSIYHYYCNWIYLSDNQLYIKDGKDSNSAFPLLPKLVYLKLKSCSLIEIPRFLKYVNFITTLDLSDGTMLCTSAAHTKHAPCRRTPGRLGPHDALWQEELRVRFCCCASHLLQYCTARDSKR
jgi:hypothetical protein